MRGHVVGETVDNLSGLGHRGQRIGAEGHRPAVPGHRDDQLELQRSDRQLNRAAACGTAPISRPGGRIADGGRGWGVVVDCHRFI